MKPLNFNRVYVNYLGYQVPDQRIKITQIAKQQGYLTKINPARSLGVKTKRLAGADEDSLTLAVEAILPGIKDWQDKIGAVYFGSESPPYAVKPAVTLLVNFLGLQPMVFGADLEFACRAGIEAVVAGANFVKAHQQAALAIGSDVAQAKAGDVLEFTASAGAGAWILSPHQTAGCLRLVTALAYTSDTPDFWRPEAGHYPAHGGRFTGQPAYFHHLKTVFDRLCQATGWQAADFAKVAIHAPNLKFPQKLAQQIGFTNQQIKPLWVDEGGNPYTASVMIQAAIKAKGLKAGQKLLILSFGSGAGAVGLVLIKE